MRQNNSRRSVRSLSKSRALGIAVMLALGSLPALAEDSPNLLEDKWQFALGTFGIDNQPEITLNGQTSAGTPVDFDKVIGGGDAYRIRLDGQWRFAKRHKVRFSAFGLSEDNSRNIDREIVWEGETIPVNAKVSAEHKWGVFEGVYEYAFMRRDNYELDVSAGLHWTAFDVSLKAKVTTPGGTGTREVGGDASVDLPLPVFGVRGIWNLSHNFWLEGAAQYFALSIDEYDGNLQDYRVMLTWQPKNWLGFGLGYNRFTVDVDVDKPSFNGTIDWMYQGPIAYYSVTF
jgi:hypothetical protein